MQGLSFPAIGSHRLRIGRCSESGRIYLVTFASWRRAPAFADWNTAAVVARTLADCRLWRGSALLCWVLMPDHWHGLIELGTTETLSTLTGRVKAVTARAANLHRGRTLPVWAPGFHDRALRREESLVGTARYIVRNPVRAGIVRSIWQYSFWDAVWLDPPAGR
jgi:REP element-mobilizing transposase RayT